MVLLLEGEEESFVFKSRFVAARSDESLATGVPQPVALAPSMATSFATLMCFCVRARL